MSSLAVLLGQASNTMRKLCTRKIRVFSAVLIFAPSVTLGPGVTLIEA
jgi:hypothetical protein